MALEGDHSLKRTFWIWQHREWRRDATWRQQGRGEWVRWWRPPRCDLWPFDLSSPAPPPSSKRGASVHGMASRDARSPLHPNPNLSYLVLECGGLDSTADSHSSQVPARESSTCGPAERKEHGKRAPGGSGVKSPSWAGLKSTLPLTLQDVGGLHRLKLPHGFCRLGAQHPHHPVFSSFLGWMAGRHEEMPPATTGLWLSPWKWGASRSHTHFLLQSLHFVEITCQVPSASWGCQSPERRTSTLLSCHMLETQKGIILPVCQKLLLWYQGLPRGSTIFYTQMKIRFVSTLLSSLGGLQKFFSPLFVGRTARALNL